jgi:hypothetical protein
MAVTIGFLVVALLPVAAAVSPDAAQPPDIPVAITQPLTNLPALHAPGGVRLPESVVTMLVGSGLLGLASIMRRTARHS